MKKRKISLFRLLFSAIVGAILFYIVAHAAFRYFWHFDIAQPRHWKHIWNKWNAGWNIHTTKEVMFFLALLGSFPAFLVSWFAMYVFPWKAILLSPLTYLKNKKKARLQQKSLEAALGPADKTKVLAAKKQPEKQMRVSTELHHKIDHLRGKGTSGGAPVAAAAQHQTAGTAVGSFSAPVEAENPADTREDLWQKLGDKLEAAKIFILRDLKIKSFPVNIFAVTQESIFALCAGPETDASWLLNESTENPVWKSDKATISSPLRPMLTARDDLQSYLAKEMPQYANLNINCCMIMDNGNFLNIDSLLQVLEEWDISVLRMGHCKAQSLPDTAALIEFIKSQPASTQTLNDAVSIAILDMMEPDAA